MIKDVAKSLIDKMPDNATWDDLMYEIYARQAIESGLEDSKAGRTKDVGEIRLNRSGKLLKAHTVLSII